MNKKTTNFIDLFEPNETDEVCLQCKGKIKHKEEYIFTERTQFVIIRLNSIYTFNNINNISQCEIKGFLPNNVSIHPNVKKLVLKAAICHYGFSEENIKCGHFTIWIKNFESNLWNEVSDFNCKTHKQFLRNLKNVNLILLELKN